MGKLSVLTSVCLQYIASEVNTITSIYIVNFICVRNWEFIHIFPNVWKNFKWSMIVISGVPLITK